MIIMIRAMARMTKLTDYHRALYWVSFELDEEVRCAVGHLSAVCCALRPVDALDPDSC